MSGIIAKIALGVQAASALASSASSFSQASKQKKKQIQAEQEADKAMKEARKRLEVNVMEGLSIQKEPYELAREAALVAGTQALQAGVEGAERGAAATAGRTYMGQLAGQERVRTAMGMELQDIERAQIEEEARLADIGMALSLEEASGAQQAAADAEKLRAAAITQGFEGITQAAAAGYQMAPLYTGGGGGGDALNPRSMGANKDMLTRRQRAPYLEAMEAYDASQLGKSVLTPGQFSSYQYRPYPGMSQSDLLMQSFGGE